jgi:ankyrin repeat protein
MMHDADVNIKDNDGNTSLHIACQGHLDNVKILIDKGFRYQYI